MPIKGDKKFDETAVLERAMKLFWKQGFEATGTAQLIKEMGIGRQSVYDTFGSKRDLFIESLRHYAETNGKLLTTKLKGDEGYFQQLVDQFEVWGEFALNHEQGCMFVNTLAELAGRDSDIQEILVNHNKGIEEQLIHTITLAIKADEVSKKLDAEQTAFTLVTLLNGLFLLSRTKPSKARIDSVIHSAEKLII